MTTVSQPTPLTYTPPDRSIQEAEDFSNNATDFAGELKVFGNELIPISEEINLVSGEINTAKTDAQTAEANASASADAAEATANATAWVSGEVISINNNRISQINFLTYRANKAISSGDNTVDPVNDPADWVAVYVPGVGAGSTTTKTGDITLVSSDDSYQRVDPQAWGKIITLPDATTMTEGIGVMAIDNVGGETYIIEDDGGNRVGFVQGGEQAILNLVDGATAAGVWSFQDHRHYMGCVAKSGALTMATSVITHTIAVKMGSNIDVIIGSHSSDSLVWAIAYDNSTGVFGSVVTVRSADASDRIDQVKVSDTVLMVASTVGTGLEVVALTLTGTSISVGTAATKTVTGSGNDVIFRELDTTFILGMTSGTNIYAVGVSISGATVTIGTTIVSPGASITEHGWDIHPLTGTEIGVFVYPQTTTVMAARPVSVSGSTATLGTADTWTIGNSGGNSGVKSWLFGSGNIGALYEGSAGDTWFSIISISGTVATESGIEVKAGTVANNNFMPQLISSTEAAFVDSTSTGAECYANILTDNAGTAAIGTEIAFASATQSPGKYLFDMTAVGYGLYVHGTDADSQWLVIKVTSNAGEPEVDVLSLNRMDETTAATVNALTYSNNSGVAQGSIQSAVRIGDSPQNAIYGPKLGMFLVPNATKITHLGLDIEGNWKSITFPSWIANSSGAAPVARGEQWHVAEHVGGDQFIQKLEAV